MTGLPLHTILRQTVGVIRKDLLVEWRAPSRFTGVLFFALAILLIVAFASNTTDIMRKQAGGMIWVGLLLASTRSLDQNYGAELEQGALEGLVLWPVSPAALFLGKATSNTLLLLAAALILTPLAIALYNAPLNGSPQMLFAFLLLGCMAIAAPGTLLGAITSQARGSSVLLPLLLFPLLVPALLASARGTNLVLLSDMGGAPLSWLAIVATFNVIYWPLSGLMFGRVVEGGST